MCTAVGRGPDKGEEATLTTLNSRSPSAVVFSKVSNGKQSTKRGSKLHGSGRARAAPV